ELERIARDSHGEVAVEGRHRMEPALAREIAGVLESRLEVVPVLDELAALGAHGRILLAAVALRHHDDRAKTDTAAGEGDALAMVAAGRRDDASDLGFAPLELGHVDETAADLEGAKRRVVLVLDPDLAARPL